MSSEHLAPFVHLSPKQACTGLDHMEQYLQTIIDKGGEGIILRDPVCSHKSGRSSGYLKHKVFIIEYIFIPLTHLLYSSRNSEIQKPN